MDNFKFNTVEEAIEAIKNGKMVLVTDDEDRENEGDLIMAAQFCTGDDVNFMAKYARGLRRRKLYGKIRPRPDLHACRPADYG